MTASLRKTLLASAAIVAIAGAPFLGLLVSPRNPPRPEPSHGSSPAHRTHAGTRGRSWAERRAAALAARGTLPSSGTHSRPNPGDEGSESPGTRLVVRGRVLDEAERGVGGARVRAVALLSTVPSPEIAARLPSLEVIQRADPRALASSLATRPVELRDERADAAAVIVLGESASTPSGAYDFVLDRSGLDRAFELVITARGEVEGEALAGVERASHDELAARSLALDVHVQPVSVLSVHATTQGAPLTGASVVVDWSPSSDVAGELELAAETGAEGSARVELFRDARGTVRVSKPGLATAAFELSGAIPATPVELDLVPAVSISGTTSGPRGEAIAASIEAEEILPDDRGPEARREGLVLEPDTPLSPLRVRFLGTPRAPVRLMAEARTDERGAFTLEGLTPNARYRVTVHPDDAYVLEAEAEVAAPREKLALALGAAGSLTVEPTLPKELLDGARADALARLLAPYVERLDPASGEWRVPPGKETLDRRYDNSKVTILTLAPGTYRVLVLTGPELAPALTAPVVVEAEKNARVAVTLAKGERLAGHVQDSDKRPMEGAQVVFRLGSASFETRSDEEGLFEIKGAPASGLTLLFAKEGFRPGELAVPEGARDAGTVRLAPGAP